MKKNVSKLKDVEKFLAAFVDQAADQGVELITGRMVDYKGAHCLLGEVLVRGGVCRYDGTNLGAISRSLGISANTVLCLMNGWDGRYEKATHPFERLGARLRARYTSRLTGRKGVRS
jgi:hypothetical protein